ncbi:SMEK domain-containing protein [Nodularia spumigena CS-591/04]|uniref:SMEK domain-containing protein n=1 Tax=Nodularia spumigena TaxID=70799 RepID=UPI00232ACDE1|nr:SMEK domain-containing protein [Nodularia spumigena]MDB9318557.1 SMEK domain-containing protein [Nodularia spumigena CS-590/01A]MDB9328614.1 SMEK domain-containing protein [Nodularia spumigena CS-590/02]MDB9333000.1 SMEK domain-containing protein [Nodularia spumigena CS-591/04]
MLTKEHNIKNISDGLSFLQVSTLNRGILGLFDQHIIAENFVAKLLNIIYDYNLVNLNKINNTYPAIDLGDYNEKICFQVTYTSLKNHRHKIKETINKFIKHQKYKKFSSLKFLFLGAKQKKYQKGFDTQDCFIFDPEKDVINLQDLIGELHSLSDEKLQELSLLIDNDLHDHKKNYLSEIQIQQQSDIEALKIYKAAFDRPALQDPFHQEGSYQDFEDALTELICLLKRGIIKKQLVTKSIHRFDDKKLEEDMSKLYHKVRGLRGLYTEYKRSGEIIPEQNISMFKSLHTPDAFNILKQDVIDHMNSILDRKSLSQIDGVS